MKKFCIQLEEGWLGEFLRALDPIIWPPLYLYLIVLLSILDLHRTPEPQKFKEASLHQQNQSAPDGILQIKARGAVNLVYSLTHP